MKAPVRLARHALAATAIAAGVVACASDAAHDATLPPPQPALALAPQGADSAGRMVRTLTLVDNGAGVVVGSFRVAVHYDSSQVTFTGSTGGDTLSIALHDAGGRVVIAGASARGFAAGEWLRLGFAPRHAGDAGATPSLEILELGDLKGGDLRARVRATPQRVVAR